MAIPSEIGDASSRASTDEYSVPQMNGRAPNSPETGSQMSLIQNPSPNLAIESCDCRVSSNAIAPTSTTRDNPTPAVMTVKPRSRRPESAAIRTL